MFSRANDVVYRLNHNREAMNYPEINDYVWQLFDYEIVKTFFGKEAKFDVFNRFLNMGYIGVLIHDNDQWITHSWASTPATLLPDHLTRIETDNRFYVLFYNHTKTEFRGKGLYKASLKLLINHINQLEKPSASFEIFADTEIENAVSRHTFLSLGFEPCGCSRQIRLRVPKLKTFKWGKWDKDQAHPPLNLKGPQ